MVYLDQILHTYLFTVTLVKTGDEASLSIISAHRGILVKMLITLEPHGNLLANRTLSVLKESS